MGPLFTLAFHRGETEALPNYLLKGPQPLRTTRRFISGFLTLNVVEVFLLNSIMKASSMQGTLSLVPGRPLGFFLFCPALCPFCLRLIGICSSVCCKPPVCTYSCFSCWVFVVHVDRRDYATDLYLVFLFLLSTALPCYPQATGSRTPTDTTIHGCSSPLHETGSCLRIT